MTVDTISEKNIDCYIILDWNNSTTRLVKKIPKSSSTKRLKASEIPIKVSLKLFIPKKPKFEITGEIEVPQAKAVEMVLDKL